jgi:very-short-patch-repair endonuclease
MHPTGLLYSANIDQGGGVPRITPWTPPTTPFTAAHVAPLGVTDAMIRWAVDTGSVTRLTRGVFVATRSVPDDPIPRHVQLALALQLRNPSAIASHHTAALAWDLDLDDAPRAAAAAPSFIVPTGASVRSKTHRGLSIAVRDLPAHLRTEHPSGLLVTTPARTAVDVAALSGVPEALITLDSAARLELLSQVGERRLRAAYTNEKLVEASRAPLLEASRSAATLRTRRALSDVVPLADPRRESANESLSYGHFLLAGLPLPEMQVRIRTAEGDAFPDFLWAEAMVIGEADGAVKYTAHDDLVREKRRQEALELMGFRVVRWMYSELRQRPSAVVGRIAAALDARGAL